MASQNLNEVDAGAGNPIHLITGNKYQREVDLPALPGVLGLEIVRHYNSQFNRLSTPNGIMGRVWKLSHETRLYLGGVSLQVVQADVELLGKAGVTPEAVVPPNPQTHIGDNVAIGRSATT